MYEHQKRVNELMAKIPQDVPEVPSEPDKATRLLRARLILEEAFETIQRGLGVLLVAEGAVDELLIEDMEFYVARAFDMKETVDGCADLSVVTMGTLSACGVDAEPVLEEVDANNLAKFGSDGYRDEHGKWIKPSDHQPPDIEGVLEKQGWKSPVTGDGKPSIG